MFQHKNACQMCPGPKNEGANIACFDGSTFWQCCWLTVVTAKSKELLFAVFEPNAQFFVDPELSIILMLALDKC